MLTVQFFYTMLQGLGGKLLTTPQGLGQSVYKSTRSNPIKACPRCGETMRVDSVTDGISLWNELYCKGCGRTEKF